MNDEILKDILTKMYYDTSKTLNENVMPLPKLLTEGIIYPTEKHLAFNQYTFGRKDGSTCTGEGMFGFCEYGYCNIQMPKMCDTAGKYIGIGDLFGDGYYYYRWCGENKQWVWLRVAKKDNQITKDFNPVKKLDPYTGLMDYASNCSTQQCKDVINQKLNPWVVYVTKILKQKCEPVFNAESNIAKLNTSKVLKYGDKDTVLKLPYVYRLQQVLRNLAELDGITLGMAIDGDFGTNTLDAVKELFKKETISIKEVEDKIKSKTGGANAPYPEYFMNVGLMKKLGWANTTCPNCKTAASHYDYCAFKEIERINSEMMNYIPYRDCQTITIEKGTQGVELPNYSVLDTFKLIQQRVGVRDDTIGNTNILGAGVATSDQIEQFQKSRKRPYFTYFFLRDFYFDQPKIQPSVQNYGVFFKKEVWPDGPYQFMRTFYQTDNYNSIVGIIKSFEREIIGTDCTDMDTWSQKARAADLRGIDKWWQWDAHGVVGIIEIGSLILGLIPSPLSPVLLGISTAAGLADAGLYYAEGDPYMGSMMLALEVIPGGELLSVLKKGKTIAKLGKEGTSELIQKAAKNQLDDAGQAMYKQVKTELGGPIGKEMTQMAEKSIVRRAKTAVTKGFSALPFSKQIKAFAELVNLCWNTLGKVPQIIIKVGGTVYTVDQLYLAINGRDEDRQNSDIRRLYYYLQGTGGMLPEEKADLESKQKQAAKQEEFRQELIRAATQIEKTIQSAPDDLVALGIKVSSQGFDKNALLEFMKTRVKNTKSVKTKSGQILKVTDQVIPTPEYDAVVDGSAFYSLGMSGGTFAQIKKELRMNWGDTLKDTGIDISTLKENPDTFDENLLKAVIMFQKNIAPQLLKQNLYEFEAGTIGPKTLKAIKTIPESMKIQTKKISPYFLQKDDYNFFYYSSRTQKWNPITYDQYNDYYNEGLESRLKAVRKNDLPIPNNRATQEPINNNLRQEPINNNLRQEPTKRKRIFNR